jgi:Trm5-related predicted tRNA methylase
MTAYPMFQAMPPFVYIFSIKKKIRVAAKVMGAVFCEILKGQMGIPDIPYLILDFMLFGEHVPIRDNSIL